MFKTNKTYNFIDGRSVVVKKVCKAWKFDHRDSQNHTIFAVEMNSEKDIIDKLVELERYDLEEAIEKVAKFCPNVQMPSDDVIRAGIIAGLKDYSPMDDWRYSWP